MVSTKRKLWTRRQALTVAEEVKELLLPYVTRIEIVGSLRREKSGVHDIELLFIPKMGESKDLLGGTGELFSLVDWKLNTLLDQGYISKRANKKGFGTWGPLNKLAYHVDSGIPIDFFATTEPCWWNSLVIRTGGKAMNLQLTNGARRLGRTLEAYGSGVRKLGTTNVTQTHSEEEVFKLCGVAFVDPCCRP